MIDWSTSSLNPDNDDMLKTILFYEENFKMYPYKPALEESIAAKTHYQLFPITRPLFKFKERRVKRLYTIRNMPKTVKTKVTGTVTFTSTPLSKEDNRWVRWNIVKYRNKSSNRP